MPPGDTAGFVTALFVAAPPVARVGSLNAVLAVFWNVPNVVVFTLTTNVTVIEPPGKIVNDEGVGTLPRPAMPNTAVVVLPDWLVAVGLRPDVLVPENTVAPVAVMACSPKGSGRTSLMLTP